jgi:hypothetical protein
MTRFLWQVPSFVVSIFFLGFTLFFQKYTTRTKTSFYLHLTYSILVHNLSWESTELLKSLPFISLLCPILLNTRIGIYVIFFLPLFSPSLLWGKSLGIGQCWVIIKEKANAHLQAHYSNNRCCLVVRLVLYLKKYMRILIWHLKLHTNLKRNTGSRIFVRSFRRFYSGVVELGLAWHMLIFPRTNFLMCNVPIKVKTQPSVV